MAGISTNAFTGSSDKVSVILMNWQRPRNIRDHILGELVKCPLVGEVLLCHCHPDTVFRCHSKQVPIRHIDYTEENTEVGLAIRFLAAKRARFSTLVYMDDDLVVHPATILNMYRLFCQRAPCIVGRFGRRILEGGRYSTDPLPTGSPAPIALTSLLMVDRAFTLRAWAEAGVIADYVQQQSRPLWNGEDIYLSLQSIRAYGKWPVFLDDDRLAPVRRLRSHSDLEVAISRKPGHAAYRSGFIREFLKRYRMSLRNVI